MNKKTKKSYEHVFNYINTNVVKLDGAVFMADFEIGLRSAIKKHLNILSYSGAGFTIVKQYEEILLQNTRIWRNLLGKTEKHLYLTTKYCHSHYYRRHTLLITFPSSKKKLPLSTTCLNLNLF